MTPQRNVFSHLPHEHGFSLIEVLLALGISAFMVIMTATVITHMMYRKNQVEDRMKSESGVLRAEWLIRSYLGQAVNIHGQGNSSLDTYSGPTGMIRLFNGNSSTMTPSITTVAVFIRESGSRAAGGSDLRPTGIFFHRPTATKSGVVFIDPGNTPSNIKPDYGDFFFDNVVEFQTRDFTYHNGDPTRPLLSAEVRVVIRYFTGADNGNGNGKSWCPRADITAGLCPQPGVPYRDDERTFRVYFRNNDLNVAARGGALREFVHGFLYFFGSKMVH